MNLFFVFLFLVSGLWFMVFWVFVFFVFFVFGLWFLFLFVFLFFVFVFLLLLHIVLNFSLKLCTT